MISISPQLLTGNVSLKFVLARSDVIYTLRPHDSSSAFELLQVDNAAEQAHVTVTPTPHPIGRSHCTCSTRPPITCFRRCDPRWRLPALRTGHRRAERPNISVCRSVERPWAEQEEPSGDQRRSRVPMVCSGEGSVSVAV